MSASERFNKAITEAWKYFPEAVRESSREQNRETEEAVFELLTKFHKETECGRDGMHWAECDALIYALGYASWEKWQESARSLNEFYAAHPNLIRPNV